jgi:hypothetical protein
MILAVGDLLKAPWLVNPILGLLLLLLIGRLGSLLHGDSTTPIMLAVLSPYFVLNCVGYLSHTSCALLIGAATWCLFRQNSLPAPSASLWTAMFALLGAAVLVRPGTGFGASVVLTGAAVWIVYSKRAHWIRLLLPALLLGSLTLATNSAYNITASGSALESPYRFFSRLFCSQLTISGLGDLASSVTFARWGLQSTQVFTVPFVFILAAGAVWAAVTEGVGRFAVAVFTCMLAAILAVHMVIPVPSASFWGERYYFEAFPGLCLLATGGWHHLRRKWKMTPGSTTVAAVALIVIQSAHLLLLVPPIFEAIMPVAQIRRLAAGTNDANLVVFLDRATTPAKHLNMNDAAWWSAPKLYLVDPGPERRAHVTSAMGRSRYAVLAYDGQDQAARLSPVVIPASAVVASSAASPGSVLEPLKCSCAE